MLRFLLLAASAILVICGGCATHKETHTPRTGVEQLLISGAVDGSLDQIDYTPLLKKKVFLESKYLDCTDKNYILVALHHRMLRAGAVLVDKPESADIIAEVGSGGVGTDGQELFVGIPQTPLPPPWPITIPRLAFVTRNKLNGTAKLLFLAYDAKTKAPVVAPGTTLARSDQNNWTVFGSGPIPTGSVPKEIAATGEKELNVVTVVHQASQPLTQILPARSKNEVVQSGHHEKR